MGLLQGCSGSEFVAHAQGVDHGHDAVEHGNAVLHIGVAQCRNRADGLGDGLRFADAARLDDDIVESLARGDLAELLDQVGLQRAADTAVLEGHQTVVLLAHHTALLNEVSIDIDFSQIIDNHRKADAFAIVQDLVDQGGLAAAQIAGQQQYRDFFGFFHFKTVSYFFSKC